MSAEEDGPLRAEGREDAEVARPVRLVAAGVVLGSVLVAQQPARRRLTGILTRIRTRGTGLRTLGTGDFAAGRRGRPQPAPPHTVGPCPT